MEKVKKKLHILPNQKKKKSLPLRAGWAGYMLHISGPKPCKKWDENRNRLYRIALKHVRWTEMNYFRGIWFDFKKCYFRANNALFSTFKPSEPLLFLSWLLKPGLQMCWLCLTHVIPQIQKTVGKQNSKCIKYSHTHGWHVDVSGNNNGPLSAANSV